MKLKDNQKKSILERLKKKKEEVKEEMTKSEAGKKAGTVRLAKKQRKETKETSTEQSSLSTLQQKMQKKLKGAQFRWINEKLYTSKSHDAVELMKEKPELFDVVQSVIILA